MHLTSRTSPSGHARACAAVLLAAGLLVPADDPGSQGGGLGWAACTPDSTDPWCDVGAIGRGSPGSAPAARQDASKLRGRTPSKQAPECHDRTGSVVPCYDPNLGALSKDGCYYKPAPAPAPEMQAVLRGADQGPGGWYDFTCPGTPGTGGGTAWVAGAGPAPEAISPQVLARQAVSRLSLPSLSIGLSPTGTQLVKVPTWLWIDPAAWKAHSATAAVPGLSVSATATPSQVIWSTGDGGSVTCSGPGTPWRAGADPAAESPTCGHVYLEGSAGQPSGLFTVSATVSWSVTWAGGGQGGALPGLTTTTRVPVRVAEVSAVVTG